jgi:hypothetical protein
MICVCVCVWTNRMFFEELLPFATNHVTFVSKLFVFHRYLSICNGSSHVAVWQNSVTERRTYAGRFEVTVTHTHTHKHTHKQTHTHKHTHKHTHTNTHTQTHTHTQIGDKFVNVTKLSTCPIPARYINELCVFLHRTL